MEDNNNKKVYRKYQAIYSGFGMIFGVSIGMSFGNLLFDNGTLGMSFGMLIGMALGSILGKEKDKKINAQVEEQGYIIKDMYQNDDAKDDIEDGYVVILKNKRDEETKIFVSRKQIADEGLKIGDQVYLNEEGTIETVDE